MTDFFDKINPDAWIQTLGSFVGALLAGVIAIWLFKLQTKHERRQRRITEIQNFIKSYYVLVNELDTIIFCVALILHFHDQDFEETRKQELIKEKIEDIKQSQNIIQSIKDEYIPHEIYKTFLITKNWIEVNIIQLGFTEISYDRSAYANALDKYRLEIVEFGEKQELELKKLLKKRFYSK